MIKKFFNYRADKTKVFLISTVFLILIAALAVVNPSFASPSRTVYYYQLGSNLGTLGGSSQYLGSNTYSIENEFFGVADRFVVGIVFQMDGSGNNYNVYSQFGGQTNYGDSNYLVSLHSSVCVIADRVGPYASPSDSYHDVCNDLGYSSAIHVAQVSSGGGSNSQFVDFRFWCDYASGGGCAVTNVHLIYGSVNGFSTPTPTPTGTRTPTATFTPFYSPTLVVGSVVAFPVHCPTLSPSAGYHYSETWLRDCGCVYGVASLGEILTGTPTRTPTLTPTPKNNLTVTAYLNTATNTATARATMSLPSPTPLLFGCSSADCSPLATKFANDNLTRSAATVTPQKMSGSIDLVNYCAVPQELADVVSVVLVGYVDTICLPSIPSLQISIPSFSFGGADFGGDYEQPEMSICLERYTPPSVAVLGLDLHLDIILVATALIVFVLRYLGRL